MPETVGMNHLGLAVKDLEKSRDFFTKVLDWAESGFDASYPRIAVSDGGVRLTLWQVKNPAKAIPFDRHANIGLHHLALEVETDNKLYELHQKISDYPEAIVEFPPEYVGAGPRKHMMCSEPGGIRIEFIWPGT